MVSYTNNNGIELQAFNTNLDTWGVDHLNPAIDQIDKVLDGAFTLTINNSTTNPYSLAITDGAQSIGKYRQIIVSGSFTGTFTLASPAKDKWWIVRNNTASAIQVTGSLSGSVTINPGESRLVVNSVSHGMYSPTPYSYIDTVVSVPTPSSTQDLDANIMGRTVVISGLTVTAINIQLTEDDVFEPSSTTIVVDQSKAGTLNILLSGLYKFDGTADSDYVLTAAGGWVNLTSISASEPHKLTIVDGYRYEAA